LNIICILDKSKVDILANLGFKYVEKEIDNKKVYQFLETTELMKELNSKFDMSSFFVTKNIYF